MSFLGRVLGGDLHRAAEYEAAGLYLEAAQAYAAAGERAKVAEMHLLASEGAPTAETKLEALREAARWADPDQGPGRKIRSRVASSMIRWVRARGLITDADRSVVAEAAALFVSAGDAAGAGACHELLGASEEAAEAYQAAGEVDRLEQVLDGEAGKRRRAVAVSDGIEEHRMRLRAGDVTGALTALDGAIAASELRDRGGLEAIRAQLLGRRTLPRQLRLRTGVTRIVIGEPPLTIGRELGSMLALRDGGVSRQHAELRAQAGGWSIVDLGSKNGTLLGGARVDRLPLPPSGELGIGDRCSMSFTVDEDRLRLEISRGLDRGLILLATSTPGGVVPVPSPAAPALRVRFSSASARVRSGDDRAERPLFVNGASVKGEIEPLIGDVLEVGDTRWDVTE